MTNRISHSASELLLITLSESLISRINGHLGEILGGFMRVFLKSVLSDGFPDCHKILIWQGKIPLRKSLHDSL